MRLCFPKSARITQSSEFARLKRHGASSAGRFFVFSVLRDGDAPARLGLITTRRVGNAVVRNLIRRRVRELFRAHRPQLATGVWLVVIARHRAGEASFAELSTEWLKLARKAEILLPP